MGAREKEDLGPAQEDSLAVLLVLELESCERSGQDLRLVPVADRKWRSVSVF